jgi:hypothetical protein
MISFTINRIQSSYKLIDFIHNCHHGYLLFIGLDKFPDSGRRLTNIPKKLKT